MKSRISTYEPFLSRAGLRRKPSPIRALVPLLQIPGIISLGAGNPNPSTFPIDKLSFSLRDGLEIQLSEKEIADALQYSNSFGLDKLVALLKQLQATTHRVPYEQADEWGVLVTNGSQDGLYKAFDTVLNEGDTVFVEEFTYSGTIGLLEGMGAKLKGIKSDDFGLIPESLEEEISILLKCGETLPKVLYVIPTGQNPTGSTMSMERREKVYQICSRHNLLIFEDDPYWNLAFTDTPLQSVKSFLQIDTDHRVLRFDSFSKVLTSGFRVGFATGPKRLIDVMQFNQQISSLHPSGLSQMVLYKVLEQWGDKGYAEHIQSVRAFYTAKKKDFFDACNEYLSSDLVEWKEPTAGMFCWFKVKGIADTQEIVKLMATEGKVIMVPGHAFAADQSVPSSYLRASFSIATKEQMVEAIKRFAKVVREKVNDTNKC